MQKLNNQLIPTSDLFTVYKSMKRRLKPLKPILNVVFIPEIFPLSFLFPLDHIRDRDVVGKMSRTVELEGIVNL
jgi:hypothetical protein